MNKRNKKKLLDVLKVMDGGLVAVSKHTMQHCKMISQLNERITRMESAVSEALLAVDKKRKDLN